MVQRKKVGPTRIAEETPAPDQSTADPHAPTTVPGSTDARRHDETFISAESPETQGDPWGFDVDPQHQNTKGPQLPFQIGKFQILRELGHGGMGTVYEAIQHDVQRRVALKIPGRLTPMDQLRFDWEAKILAQLQDPGIAAFYEHGTAADDQGIERQYFAMELVNGETLTRYFAKAHPELRDQVSLLQQVARTTGRVHRRGIVHRDLKPDNILVDSSGSPRILDFGVAQFREGRPEVLKTISGQVVGTIAYMAPEQARGDSDQADSASDVYALGTILYEVLTGQHPLNLKKKSIVEMLATIERDMPKPMSQIDRRLGGDLDIIVGKAMRKEPGERYASGAELADDLERWLTNVPISARQPTIGYVLRKLAQRHRLITTAAAIVLLVAVLSGVLVVRAWGHEHEARVDADNQRKQVVEARRGELEQELVRYQQRGDWKAVLASVGTLEGLNAGDRNLYATHRAVALFVLGKYEDSRQLLDELAQRESELGPNLSRVQLYRGLLSQTRDGDTPTALRLISQALESKQLSPGDSHFAQAFLAKTRDAVVSHLREGVKAEPFNYLCISHLATLLTATGDESEATAIITLGEQLFPFDSGFLECRLGMQMRRIGTLDVNRLRIDAERRMHPSEVDRTIRATETNFEYTNVMDQLFEAMCDGDMAKAMSLQAKVQESLLRNIGQVTSRQTSFAAPLPGVDPGLKELFQKIPLAMLGIGKDSLVKSCRDKFRATQDPLLAFIAFITRMNGVSSAQSLPLEQIVELVDLLGEASERPCLMRRLPNSLRFLRLAMIAELTRRADHNGETENSARWKKEFLADCRILIDSDLTSHKQRSLLFSLLAVLGGRPTEVRALGEEMLAVNPDDGAARVLVALMEVNLGNPDRAEQLLRQKSPQNHLPDSLRAFPDHIQGRIRGIRSDQLMFSRQQLEASRAGASDEIMTLSRSYDRLGRSADAEQSARGVLGLCDQTLNTLGTAPESAGIRATTLNLRAIARWRLGDIDGACEDSLFAIDAEPSNHWRYFVAAPRLLLAEKREEYLRVSRDCLNRFGGSEDPAICERVAKASLYAPDPELIADASVATLRAVTIGKDHAYNIYFRMADGMAAVRRGDYDAGKGEPFASQFDSANFMRFPAILLHALGSRGTPAEAEARQRVLDIAPYFSQLNLPTVAYDHDLTGQLILYREVAAAYQLEPLLNSLRHIQWQVPTAIRGVNSRGQALAMIEDGTLRNSIDDPGEVCLFHLRVPKSTTALRFEALPDPELPHHGPGTVLSTGRCQIHDLRLVRVRGEVEKPIQIAWGVPAGSESPQGRISAAWDTNRLSGWGPSQDDRLGQPLDGVLSLTTLSLWRMEKNFESK